MTFDRFLVLALLASAVLALGLVVVCSDDNDDYTLPLDLSVEGMVQTVTACVNQGGATPEESAALAGVDSDCWSDCIIANTTGDCGDFTACLARDCGYTGG